MADIRTYLVNADTLFWADRRSQVQSEILKAQNRAGLSGIGRSAAAVRPQQEACERGLDDLLAAHLDSVRRALEAFRPKANQKLQALLEEPFAFVLTNVCSELNPLLSKQAELMGLPNQWSLDARRDLLVAKACNELGPVLASHAAFLRSVHKP